jgi:hypothetical protein
MAQTESITVSETDDETLLRASKLLAEQRRMLTDVNGILFRG